MTRKTVAVGVVIFVALIALAVLLPPFIRARNTPARQCGNACVNNLRLVQGAKEQWALELHKSTNDTPSCDDLRTYVGRGPTGELPQCPQGGKYIIETVADKARCSLGGPQRSL